MGLPVWNRSLKLRLAAAGAVNLASEPVAFMSSDALMVGLVSMMCTIGAGFVFIRLGPVVSKRRAIVTSSLAVCLLSMAQVVLIMSAALVVGISSNFDSVFADNHGLFIAGLGLAFLLSMAYYTIFDGITGALFGAVGGLLGAATLSAPPVEQGYGQQQQAPPVEPRDPNDPWA